MSIPATQRWIGDDGEMETGRSSEFELELTDYRIKYVFPIGNEGGSVQVSKQHFKELLVTMFISIAKLVRNMSAVEADTMAPEVAPRLGLKLNSLFWLIDELWDDMRQLISTGTKFLATCILLVSPLRTISPHCS